jgi:putative autotransporter adhesin-like protein
MKAQFLSLLLILAFSINVNNVFADTVKEERKVSAFSGVDLRIAGDVLITQGTTQKVIVEGDADDIKDLKTEVSAGVLIIKFEGWKVRYGTIKVYVTAAQFESLEVSGSGSIIAQSDIKTDDLEVEVSGSGKIKVEKLEANEIEAEISGSGKIYLDGDKEAQSLEFDISGSGDIYADGIKIKNIEGDISGSGKADVNCTGKLEADISGSGRIYYKGNCQVDADISGSGSVRNND